MGENIDQYNLIMDKLGKDECVNLSIGEESFHMCYSNRS